MHSPTATREFDRTNDVSKLIGCNIRNVEYRWSIFAKFLEGIAPGAPVLDFGAGSLRETFDLAERGFRVTSVDMAVEDVASYRCDYDWSRVAHQPDFRADLPDEGQFEAIIAFDVVEHLAQPEALMARFHRLLSPEGMIFLSVPNRLTLKEYLTEKRGPEGLRPGAAHLQFKSPNEWRQFFERCDFAILEHDMTIGPIVNTTHILAHGIRKNHWHRPFAGFMDRVDAAMKPLVWSLYGWNLMVLRRK